MREQQSEKWLTNYIKENPLQVTLQLIGVGVLILNLWLASKLSPVVRNLDSVTTQVEAMQKTLDRYSVDHDDIQAIKANVVDIKENVSDIKASLNYLIQK